jgi:hypothetical protein
MPRRYFRIGERPARVRGVRRWARATSRSSRVAVAGGSPHGALGAANTVGPLSELVGGLDHKTTC